MRKRIRGNTTTRQSATEPAALSDLAQPQHTHQGKQCPKCSHIRSLSDAAPDWQCPVCKAAYNKVSAEYAAHLQQEQMESIAKLRMDIQARKLKSFDLAGISMFIGLFITTTCLTCGCGPHATSSLWILGGGIAALLGGFVFWLGGKVSHLHRKNKDLRDNTANRTAGADK